MPMITNYLFRLDSFDIVRRRAGGVSMRTDTDYVSFTVKVGNAKPQTQVKRMGDLDTGTHGVDLLFHIPVDTVAPSEQVIVNYLIVNAGHKDPSFVETSLESIGKSIVVAAATAVATNVVTAASAAAATAAGAEIGGTIGTAIPGLGTAIGSAVGACAGWCVGEVTNMFTANCDGPVAAEQRIFRGSDLLKNTASDAFRQRTTHPGVPSPSGCGEDSLYIVDWHLSRVQGTVLPQYKVGGNTTSATPCVTADGWVYFRGTDDKLWKVRSDGSGQMHIGNNTTKSTPFVTSDGWVWFQGTDDKLWKVFNNGSDQSQPRNNWTASSPVVVGNWVYFRGTDNKLWQLRTDGTAQNQVHGNTTSSAPFVTADGWVLFPRH